MQYGQQELVIARNQTDTIQEELSQARAQIEELQEESRSTQESNQGLRDTISRLESQAREQADEVAAVRSRTTLSQSNWVKERDELISREAFAREEFETAKQAMQDWEVLAMEERSLRENLSERVAEFEEQLQAQREAYEQVASERDTQNLTVDGLQRALQEIQDGELPRCIRGRLLLTCPQLARLNSASWLRVRKRNSSHYAPRPKPPKALPLLLQQRLRVARKSSNVLFRSRRRSERRIC